MHTQRRCPFCHQEFGTMAAVIAHVEGQLCIADRHTTAHEKHDLYFRIETNLMRVEVQMQQRQNNTSAKS